MPGWKSQFANQDVKRIPLHSIPWRRIWSYFHPYRIRLISVIFVILAVSLSSSIQPILIKFIVDQALPHSNMNLLDKLTLCLLGLVVVNALLGVLQSYITSWIGEAVMYDLRIAMYRHLQKLSVEFFTKTKSGDILSRMTNDVQQLQGVVSNTYGSTVSNLLTVVTSVIAMYSLSPVLATLCIVILPMFIIPTRRVGNITYRLRRDTQAKLSEMSAHMSETLSLSGVLLVKLFGRQAEAAQTFTGLSHDVRRLDIRQTLVGRWFFVFVNILTSAGPAIIYFAGGHQLFGEKISIGTMVAFTVYLTRLFQPVSSLAGVTVNIYGSVALFQRLFEYLDIVPSIQEKPDAVILSKVAGRLEFQNVDFSYDGTRSALHHVNLEVNPGQMIALVGPSGAGKSTLSYLMARLYDPDAGNIFLDGIDLRDLRLSSLADAVGMVTQDTFLFHATIAENLLFAKPDATDQELVAAATAASIHEMITSLPEGYQTMVGERGHKLSGGEKQRISIARVLLKNPRVVVLDEATSALDSASERAVQDALSRLMSGRTAVVIAHRLSTILDADRIYVVAHGEVVESGPHSELLQQGGVYQHLFNEQFARAMKEASL